MDYRIKHLQLIIDQFLPGDYEINHAKMHYEGEDLEWFELIEWTDLTHTKHRCKFSAPQWVDFVDGVHTMLAIEIEFAREY